MQLYKNKEWLAKNLKEIKNKNEIARLANTSSDTIEYWRKKFNLPNYKYVHRIHKVDESFFKMIDTEEKVYWLGFIMADGYISISSRNKISNAITNRKL